MLRIIIFVLVVVSSTSLSNSVAQAQAASLFGPGTLTTLRTPQFIPSALRGGNFSVGGSFHASTLIKQGPCAPTGGVVSALSARGQARHISWLASRYHPSPSLGGCSGWRS
jgi:hypothetical protein